MLYPLIVCLTMFILPVASILIDSSVAHEPWPLLVGKWFVFWAVGVRLSLAGVRQYFQPSFTSRDILGIESPQVYILVRELGGANAASGLVGLLSLVMPTFVLPSTLGAGIFYAVAGFEHVRSDHRGRNETIAMVSDLFVAAVLLAFAIWVVAN